MTKEELYKGLKEALGLPTAYHHFDNPPTIPFVAYIDLAKERYVADNKVYYDEPTYRVELYYETNINGLDDKLEQFFDDNDIVWADDDTVYIKDEELYMKVYYI